MLPPCRQHRQKQLGVPMADPIRYNAESHNIIDVFAVIVQNFIKYY